MSGLIGGLTGAIEITLTFPFEYTKTCMQLQNRSSGYDVVRDTIRSNGFLGLYKGFSSYLIFAVPKSYVRFGTYSFFNNNIFTSERKLHYFLSGVSAGFAESLTVVIPQETLKTKLIHDEL